MRHRVEQHRLGHAANREIAAQISAHSPSGNSTTEISASARIQGRARDCGSCRIRPEAAEQTHYNVVCLSICSSNYWRKPHALPRRPKDTRWLRFQNRCKETGNTDFR